MLRFDKIKVAKEEFCSAKKSINIWDVDVNNIVISKLIEMKNNSKHFIGYLDEVIIPLVLILSKDKGGDKNKNNRLMSLNIDDDKLLEKLY